MAAVGLIYRHFGKEIILECYPHLKNLEDQLVIKIQNFY